MNTPSDQLIVIEGPEQSMVEPVPTLADAGLPPAPGVKSYQVFRASKVLKTDEKGYTYHHHVDLAIWKGRLYVGWNSCEIDEDIWPSRELYSTSSDGVKWDEPREMFPQAISTCLRIYFYHAKNGVMLMFGGLRTGPSKTDEANKGAMVVRRINEDHTLGPIFRTPAPPKPPINKMVGDEAVPPAEQPQHPEQNKWTWGTSLAMFESSSDEAFKAAVQEMIDNRVFLEQQDLGRLLGNRRMKWHDPANWPGGKVPGDSPKWVAGKAYSFFIRPDGLRVGISKMGWCTSSSDNGVTWQQPDVPKSLVTGKAKVWSQKTCDGNYALVYNPTARTRYPLIVVTGKDGTHFGGMRIVQGELPIQRYPGADRSVGPQYIRGVSEWADDGSRHGEGAMWLLYSMSKEDIWVTRVPIPIPPETNDSDWILYQPKWSNISADQNGLALTCTDPYDYASATKIFGAKKKVEIGFDFTATGSGEQSIDVLTEFGSKRPVQLRIVDGNLLIGEEKISVAGKVKILLSIDVLSQKYVVKVSGVNKEYSLPFAEMADNIHRISFRTGSYRNIGGKKPVDEKTDIPTAPKSIHIGTLLVK